MSETDGEVPTQVRQVRRTLLREFESLLDMSDVMPRPESEREQRLLSRALSALAVRLVTGCDARSAAAHVIDGINDHGIDAIAPTHSPPHVYLVQTKWSDQGTARLDQDAAVKLVDGLDRIDAELSDQFNLRGEALAEQAKSLMTAQSAPVTLVIALMGTTPLGPGSTQVLDNAELRYNQYGARLDRRVLFARDFHQLIRDDLDPPPLDLSIVMSRWLRHDEPRRAFQGTVRVEEVAGWYWQYGDRLFNLNIRDPLGSTRTNVGITSTLTDDPSSFWYFNNGITILCDRLDIAYGSVHAPQSSPVTLNLHKTSIVNGAQTVTAIAEAMSLKPSAAASAHVSVRVIETGGADQFSQRTTQATNQQNRVEARDFIALDPIQSEIRADMAAELDKEYTVKRGAADPAPNSGCSIVEAATALACAHPNPEYAARAKRSNDLLWERGDKGAYDVLFRSRPSAYQIWRSVITVRAVRDALHAQKPRPEGRAAAIVQHGDLLIAHLVLQHLGTSAIDDPDHDWDGDVMPRVPSVTDNVRRWLIHHIDGQFGPTSQIASTFINPDRCKQLAKAVLADLHGGLPIPALAPEYTPAPRSRKARRPNAVSLLVDAKAIEEGTPLVFAPEGKAERHALATWLAADPKRGHATWINDRSEPILWAADQKQYSPSGLVSRIWELANWENRPVANQGTRRWRVNGGESLLEMALRLQNLDETAAAE